MPVSIPKKRNPLRLLVLTALFSACSFSLFAADYIFSVGRGLLLTATPRTCYSTVASVSYFVPVENNSGGAYTCGTHYTVNTTSTYFELRSGPLETSPLVTTIPGSALSMTCVSNTLNLTGTFLLSNAGVYPPGIYTVVAKIIINDIPNGVSKVVNSSSIFSHGYGAQWTSLTDMQASPSTYACKRSQVSANLPYGTAIATNYLSGNTNGWIEVTPQFGTATASRSLYVLLDNNGNTTTFPATNATYVEYRKGGTSTVTTGEGIYVKSAGIVYKLQSATLTTKIRIERISGVLKFYNQGLTTAYTAVDVSTPTATPAILSIPYTVGLTTAVYAVLADDGFSRVIFSAACSDAANIFVALSDKLDGKNYKATDKLCFSYEEAYAINSVTPLNYKIYNSQHKQVQGSTGTNIVTVNRVYGDNRYELNVSGLGAGSTYILEVTNDKKEVFYLRFSK
jgi:hypothetical protein